jgi:hypothetical protein
MFGKPNEFTLMDPEDRKVCFATLYQCRLTYFPAFFEGKLEKLPQKPQRRLDGIPRGICGDYGQVSFCGVL